MPRPSRAALEYRCKRLDDIDDTIVDDDGGAIPVIEVIDGHAHAILRSLDRLTAHRTGAIDHECDIDRAPFGVHRSR
ncbi:MAG: hypothetical protein R2845_12510 [Thermomicrobiales bacterium]